MIERKKELLANQHGLIMGSDLKVLDTHLLAQLRGQIEIIDQILNHKEFFDMKIEEENENV